MTFAGALVTKKVHLFFSLQVCASFSRSTISPSGLRDCISRWKEVLMYVSQGGGKRLLTSPTLRVDIRGDGNLPVRVGMSEYD